MRPLFISMVCDYCDGLVSDDETANEGYVVWQGKTLPAQEYVFKNRADAERWRAHRHLDGCSIVSVRSPVKFRWRKSSGTMKGLEMADALVTIFEDNRFPIGPNRAYVIAA